MRILNIERGKSFKGHQATSFYDGVNNSIVVSNHYYNSTIKEIYNIDEKTKITQGVKWIDPSPKYLTSIIDSIIAPHKAYVSKVTCEYEDDLIKMEFCANHLSYIWIMFTMSSVNNSSHPMSNHYNNIQSCKKLDKYVKGVLKWLKDNTAYIISTSVLKNDSSEVIIKGIDSHYINLYL